MLLIASRTIPYLATESLAAGELREALFRDDRGDFILYFADSEPPSVAEEHIVRLGLREALIWLNEPAENQDPYQGLFCV